MIRLTYKKIFGILVLSTAALCIQATPPETTSFDVNGLKVIHRSSVKDVISVRLFVKGGVTNYSPDKAGIESLAFDLATSGGTANMDKDAYAAALDRIGSSVNGSSGRDYGTLNLTCLKEYWDESWTLYTEAVMHPAMPESQFNLLQQQMLAMARQSEADADSYLENLIYENAFKNTSYSADPDGDKTTIPDLSLEEVKKYYGSLLGKNRCFLVVVGDVSDADLKKKIAESLANLPDGESVVISETMYKPEAGQLIEPRTLTTNYVTGLMSAPTVNSADYVPNQLAMNMMYDRYFTELRTKRSLSYAPAASYVSNIQHPFNRIYISTTDPKQSMKVMTAIIDSLKTDGFSQEELTDKKSTFMTYHYMGMETNEALSRSLGRYEIISSWEDADKWPEKIKAATLDDINKVIREYCGDIYWIYLGNEDQVKSGDFPQL